MGGEAASSDEHDGSEMSRSPLLTTPEMLAHNPLSSGLHSGIMSMAGQVHPSRLPKLSPPSGMGSGPPMRGQLLPLDAPWCLLASWSTIIPYAASSLVSLCSTLVARKARKQDAHEIGSVTSLRRDPLTSGCMAGATDPAIPNSCNLCRSKTLSAKNSLKSTNLPLCTRSTTLAGIGGSAGEIISGSDLLDDG